VTGTLQRSVQINSSAAPNNLNFQLGRPNVTVNYRILNANWNAITQVWNIAAQAYFNANSDEDSRFKITGLEYLYSTGAGSVYNGAVAYGKSVTGQGGLNVLSVNLPSTASLATSGSLCSLSKLRRFKEKTNSKDSSHHANTIKSNIRFASLFLTYLQTSLPVTSPTQTPTLTLVKNPEPQFTSRINKPPSKPASSPNAPNPNPSP
jgi:hypothetical protein